MKLIKDKIALLTLIKPSEQKSAVAAFILVFVLMAVYFILRPVRDAMASDWSDSEVSFLWNIQFFLSTGIVMLYCFAINRIQLQLLVPIIYAAFAATFFLFYILTQGAVVSVWVEKAFYLWVTSFSLLNISVFWSFMAETFSQEQGKRLFSFISAGASSGAILGPAIPTLFAESLGLPGLMLMAAIGLMVAIPVIIYLTNNRHSESNHLSPKDAVKQTMEGHWWSGFRDVMKNPVLIGIALFILLYVFINSFVYFQQKNLLAAFSRADRAQILGGIDWLVNLLTFVFALAITSRMVKRMGMSLTLACVPFAMVFGFVVLALAPVVVVLLGIQTFRRVGNYAITRPAREMLFTQVSLEERFKAKPVIDVVVYRGGDAISASVYAVFSDSLGLGLFALSLIGASIAGAWASIGLMLGRLFDQKTKQSINKTTVDIESTENKSTKQFIT